MRLERKCFLEEFIEIFEKSKFDVTSSDEDFYAHKNVDKGFSKLSTQK